MTPDASPTPGAGMPGRRVRIRKKKRRHGQSRFLRDLWLPLLLLAAVAAVFGVRFVSNLKPAGQIAGYIGNSEVLSQEYAQFEGKPLHDMPMEQQFSRAAALAEKGEFKGAALLLESISRKCAEPVVFHDLGVLYAQMNDHDRALRAFREALARDATYAPVHLVLNSLRGFDAHSADPVTSEAEPNGTYLTANLIALGSDVVGEISAGDDLDCYRFSAPPSPRDLLRIELKSQSVSLAPRLTVYDDNGHPTGEIAGSPDPGAGLTLVISPKPNTTLFVEVGSNQGTVGAYALKITAMKAFDRYEPDDDIDSAHPIVVAQEISANIMSGDDLDFYSFVADRSGIMTITLQRLSDALIPALATFDPNRQPVDYAIPAAEQNQRIVRSITVEESQIYYLEVWGKSKTTGSYSLTVQ